MSGLQDPASISFAELVLSPRFPVERNPRQNRSYALIDGFVFPCIENQCIVAVCINWLEYQGYKMFSKPNQEKPKEVNTFIKKMNLENCQSNNEMVSGFSKMVSP